MSKAEHKEYISFDQCPIFYRYSKGKTNQTLIFLHGVGGNWTVWKKELEYFEKKGYSTLALDLRGHGKSGCPHEFKSYSLPHFSRDIYGLLQHEKIKNFSLIGHSLGGGIIINYLMRYKGKSPSSAVLIESCSVYPFTHDRILMLNPYLVELLRYIERKRELRKEQFPHFQDVDLSEESFGANFHLISHLLHLTPLQSVIRVLDNVEEFVHKNKRRIEFTLENLSIPLLLVAGEKDTIVPIKFSKIIKKLYSKAHMKILKNADHRVIINDASEVNGVLYSFLQGKK